MGIFDGLSKAQYFEGGKYLQPGLFLLEILKVKSGHTRGKLPFFVSEMKVLEASDTKEFPIGTNVSWMVMLNQDAALGNLRHFLSVASNTPIVEVTEEDAEEAVAEANPLAGVKIRAMAVNVKTRAGKDFTKVKFMPESTSSADMEKAFADEKKSSEKGTAPAADAAPAAPAPTAPAA